jgi:FHA domain-containing protein
MELLENLQKLKRQLTRAEFEKKFQHPWLIRELDEDERPALFRTMVTNIKRHPSPPKRSTASDGYLRLLGVDPSRFGLYPLSKSGSNPWSDRVLVGRASNNDIVLKNDRISKLHAYFQCGARGIWRLYDAKSANGTRVDGVAVPSGEEGVEIHSGQVVLFGTVATEVVDSATLYDSL